MCVNYLECPCVYYSLCVVVLCGQSYIVCYQPTFFSIFVTTSELTSIITIVYVLPIHYGHFAPLLVYFGYLLAFSCYFDSETISANFNCGLGCAGSSANNAFSQFSTTNNHNIINSIFQPQPMELWTSMQTVHWHLSNWSLLQHPILF